jgi:hypothetical protein
LETGRFKYYSLYAAVIKKISPTTPPSEMPIRFNGMMNMKAELEEISAKVGRNKSKLSDPALVTVIASK